MPIIPLKAYGVPAIIIKVITHYNHSKMTVLDSMYSKILTRIVDAVKSTQTQKTSSKRLKKIFEGLHTKCLISVCNVKVSYWIVYHKKVYYLQYMLR